MCSNAKSEAFGVARRAFGKGLPFARDTFGERTFGRKKRYSSIQRRGLKTLTKGLAFIPRDIFFLNIITHDERRRRRRRRRSSSVFFRAGGAFFMINMSFWFGRDTKRRVLVCLLLRKKKVLRYVLLYGRFRYRSWIRSNKKYFETFLRFFVSLSPPPLFLKHPPLLYPVVSSFLWGLLSNVMNERHRKERKKERKKEKERERERHTERFFYDAST